MLVDYSILILHMLLRDIGNGFHFTMPVISTALSFSSVTHFLCRSSKSHFSIISLACWHRPLVLQKTCYQSKHNSKEQITKEKDSCHSHFPEFHSHRLWAQKIPLAPQPNPCCRIIPYQCHNLISGWKYFLFGDLIYSDFISNLFLLLVLYHWRKSLSNSLILFHLSEIMLSLGMLVQCKCWLVPFWR